MKNTLRYYNFPEFLLNLKTMLILGSFVHIIATFCVYLIGRFAIFPNWIFSQGSMREDAFRYLEDCELLSQEISKGNYGVLLSSTEHIHTRFYALAHYLLSDILGSNILVFELVNIPLFLLILFSIYKIGETLFNKKVGFISAYIVLFFPSFILHTTQPLRDTFFIAAFLVLFLFLLRLVDTPFDLRSSFIGIAFGIPIFLLLWFVRDAMILVYLGIILIAIVFILFKNVKNKWKYKFNLIPILALLIFAVVTPYVFAHYLPLKQGSSQEYIPKVHNFIKEQMALDKPGYLIKINTIRHRFSLSYEGAGSNIDEGYVFEDTFAFIMYIPKATLVGLFSPFPNDWLGEGSEYGKAGRILAGIETAVMYIFILLSIFCIVKNINVKILFVALSVLMSITALGLVVLNVGAIYRLRYVFWFLVIIVGVNGIFELIKIFSNNKNSDEALE